MKIRMPILCSFETLGQTIAANIGVDVKSTFLNINYKLHEDYKTFKIDKDNNLALYKELKRKHNYILKYPLCFNYNKKKNNINEDDMLEQ